MHPLLKRILIHGVPTAGVLALVGLMFAEMAAMWGGEAVDPSIRYRLPLAMAFWGFAFVAVCESVMSRVRRRAPAKPPEPADDAEKLLNELLEQAESRMAAESQQSAGEGRVAGDDARKPAQD